jgi:hypothetical protein
MSVGEFEIRPYEAGDERAINDGFNEAFRLDRSLDEWAWKFAPSPTGRLIMIAEQDGQVLAHYGAIPARFQIDDAAWDAGQIVDVYSARKARKAFSRRGVWVQTVERFYGHFGDSGRCPLLYGFPSPRPLRLGVLQLDYDAMKPQPITYLCRRPPRARVGPRRLFYRAELARDWEPRLDELWERVRSQYPVAVVRNADWALRRLAGRPSVRYHRFLVFPRLSRRPVAFAAFRSDGGRCRWVDLLWHHEHPGALQMLIHLSGRLAEQTGAELEELWLNGDAVGRSMLEASGFVCEPEPGKLVMVAKAFDPGIDLGRVDQRVYLTMADADLV